MFLEGKMPNVGGRHFGMVVRLDFLMEFFFPDGGCFGKVTGSRMEVVVVDMVVGMVERVIWGNFRSVVGGCYIAVADG